MVREKVVLGRRRATRPQAGQVCGQPSSVAFPPLGSTRSALSSTLPSTRVGRGPEGWGGSVSQPSPLSGEKDAGQSQRLWDLGFMHRQACVPTEPSLTAL